MESGSVASMSMDGQAQGDIDSDKYESDNLIWQLEMTLNKLAIICKKNGKLVDYINKKVCGTVSNFNQEKDNFKKLSWAEMDDSDLDLDLDLDITITADDHETTSGETQSQTDKATAVRDPINQFEGGEFEGGESEDTRTRSRTCRSQSQVEGATTQKQKKQTTTAQKQEEQPERARQRRMRSKLMFVQRQLLQRRQKLELTEKFEIEELVRKKAEQELRMKRAEERVEKQHKMMREKNKALTWKLAEIAHSNELHTENMKNAIRRRQIKAEKKKEKIKNNKKKQLIRVNNKLAIYQKLTEFEHRKLENSMNRRHEMNRNYKRKLGKSTQYFNETELKRLCGKFLYIPRVVRKSLASDLFETIEKLYRDTSPLLSAAANGSIASELSSILSEWLKKTSHIHFGHSKYKKDVLLIVNRLICFDFSANATQLMLQSLCVLTKNKVGTELLCAKYSMKLLSFAAHNVNNDSVMTLLGKMFENEFGQMSRGNKNTEYWRFKKETLSLLLFNLFKSSWLCKISIAMATQSIINRKAMDSILHILIQITLILENYSSWQVCQLISNQLFVATQCVNIIDFVQNAPSSPSLAKCLLFLKHATKCNKAAMTKLVVTKQDQFCDILSAQFERICTQQFNLNIAHHLFDFLTIAAISNPPIQDIVDAKLICDLCNEIPFYFVAQKQNLLFPALIGLSLNHETNFDAIATASDLNIKHVQKYIRRNIYAKNRQFENKIPSKYWSNCLKFY